MEFDLIPHTIFLALMGSHAYGLNTSESDEDYKGVLIPPPDFIYGFNKHFEQFETKVPNDTAIFNITKFFSLATSCNPTIIEMLFVDDAFVKRTSDYWERVKEVRDKFLSTKAAFSFSGYAFSQLARIKTHRQYLLNPPTKEPSKDDFKLNDIQGKIIPNEQLGAANKVIDDLIEEWLVTDEKFPKGVKEKVIENVGLLLRRCWETLMNTECHVNTNEILWKTAAHHLGYESNFIEYMSREKAYKNAVKSWKSYQNWKNTRNPKRAILEEKFGYDTKHSSHLVRLLLMGEEVLSKGEVNVFRKDAEILKGIREGAWKFEELLEWADKQQKKIYEIYDNGTSPLPKSPDENYLNQVCIELQTRFISEFIK